MQAGVRGRDRTTRAPPPDQAQAPNLVSVKALPVARRGARGHHCRRISKNLPEPVRINHPQQPAPSRSGAQTLPLASRLVTFCHLARMAQRSDVSASGPPRGNRPLVMGAEGKMR